MRYMLLPGCLAALTFSCTKEKEPVLTPLSGSEISGERLWKRITVDTDYDIYAHWPGPRCQSGEFQARGGRDFFSRVP